MDNFIGGADFFAGLGKQEMISKRKVENLIKGYLDGLAGKEDLKAFLEEIADKSV